MTGCWIDEEWMEEQRKEQFRAVKKCCVNFEANEDGGNNLQTVMHFVSFSK